MSTEEMRYKMAIFKVITSPDGSAIGRATPEKLEDYLKFEENEQGERIPRTDKITALNASSESFSEDCEMISMKFDKCNTYDEVKYRHYVQGFPPEDCSKMTRERCHQLGLEMAKAFWGDFPVLVVTHYNQEVEGEDGAYHWHNHFLVYNCNINNGRKIDRSGNSLWEQKKYVAAQAEANGLTRKGLILENGRIRESKVEVRAGMQERKIRIRGQAVQSKRDAQEMFFTQKAELRIAIITALDQTSSYEEFCKFLKDAYGIETKESRGALGFLHPERKGSGRAWIRGASLGDLFTKESILNEFYKRNDGRSDIQGQNEDGSTYLERLYRQVFGYIPTGAELGAADRADTVADRSTPGDLTADTDRSTASISATFTADGADLGGERREDTKGAQQAESSGRGASQKTGAASAGDRGSDQAKPQSPVRRGGSKL